MAAFRLRQPQFSEDLAWLPAWLQHPPAESCAEHVKESQSPSQLVVKNHGFLQGKIVEGGDENLSVREEGRYDSCHLFLSGEDCSPIASLPVSANVLHFCLHLSEDSNLESKASPFVEDFSQKVRSELKNATLNRQVQSLTASGEKRSQSKLECTAGIVNLPSLVSRPTKVEDSSPRSLTSYKNGKRMNEEKTSISCLKVAEVDHAVELSVAASEALVIHELLKNDSPSEAFPAAAVLEAALRVKQARLALEDSVQHTSDEIEDLNLSDFDDSTMANAFEDVGLLMLGSDTQCPARSVMSYVEETPISETCGFDDISKRVDQGTRAVNSDDILIQKHSGEILDVDMVLRSLPSQPLYCEGQHNHSDNSAIGLNGTCFDSPINPILHQSHWDNSNFEGFDRVGRGVGFSMVDNTSFRPLVDEDSPPLAWNLVNREGEGANLVSDRFRSRWFGGWTGKANSKSVPKPFVGETSFLSESAEIAPDENSFVLKNQTSSMLASQCSIQFDCLCDKANEEMLPSQVKPSSISLEEPLCSVVPCSISLENDGLAVDQNQNDKEVDAENNFRPTSEIGRGNVLQGASGLHIKLFHAEEQDVPTSNGKGNGITIQKRFTSLKSYSRLSSHHGALSKGVNSYCDYSFPLDCNGELLSSGRKMDHCRPFGKSDSPGIFPCISSHKSDSKGLLPVTSLSKYAIHKEYEHNKNISDMRHSVTSLTNEKKYCKPTHTGPLLQEHVPQKRNSSFCLDQRTHCQLQSSKHPIENFSKEKSSKCAAVPDIIVDVQPNKKLEMPQPEQNSHGIQVQIRKRVHFLEDEVQHTQNKKSQKIQTTYKTSSAIRTFTRSRSPNLGFDPQNHQMNWYLRNNCVNEKLIFQGIEFLLTGFSTCKEKDIEQLIRKYGGIILPTVPSPSDSRRRRSSNTKIPIVLCSKKLQTTKFLYGCAVNAFILKVDWLNNSVAAGSVLPPEKYLILSNEGDRRHARTRKPIHPKHHKCIFEKVGIMLHGRPSFCTKFAKICKHGGGQVSKTLQFLVQSLHNKKISVGVIVAEDENKASRHLRLCASEGKIPMMPASWIVDSLHSGKLLPLRGDNHSSPLTMFKVQAVRTFMEFSAEI